MKSVLFLISLLSSSLLIAVNSNAMNKNFLSNQNQSEKHKKNAIKKGWFDSVKTAGAGLVNNAINTVQESGKKALESAKEAASQAANQAMESGKEAATQATNKAVSSLSGLIKK